MEHSIVPFSDIEKMAGAITRSGLFGVKDPSQAVALMLIAQAEGVHPATAARDYNIIQGRPALKADAMMARFQQSGGKVQWEELTDNRVAATFSHPSGGSALIDWDMARAKSAGLGGKDMWKKYPRQMLRSRVVSEGIRTVYPGVAIGVYTPEEVMDFDDAEVVKSAKVSQQVIEAPQTTLDEMMDQIDEIAKLGKIDALITWYKNRESLIKTLNETEQSTIVNTLKATRALLEEQATPVHEAEIICPNGVSGVTDAECAKCAVREGCPAHK